MANVEQVKRLQEAGKALIETRVDDWLARREDWAGLTFEEVRTPLSFAWAAIKNLLHLPIEALPDGAAQTIQSSVEQLLQALREMTQFSIRAGADNRVREGIITNIRSYCDQVVHASYSWIGFLAFVQGDFDRHLTAIRGTAEAADAFFQQARAEVTSKVAEVEQIISAARTATASAGIVHFATDFQVRAKELNREALWWLAGAVLLAVLTLAGGTVTYLHPVEATSNAQVLQQLTSKLLILATLLTATLWCGRIYKATKHQAAMNDHRANALKTFQAFVKSTADPAIKDAVLLESTRAIFAAGSTGYLDGGDSGAEGPAKVLEIIKGVSRPPGP